MKLSIKTLSIMILCLTASNVTKLSMTIKIATYNIPLKLSVVTLSIVTQSVVTPSVVMLNIVMSNVAAPVVDAWEFIFDKIASKNWILKVTTVKAPASNLSCENNGIREGVSGCKREKKGQKCVEREKVAERWKCEREERARELEKREDKHTEGERESEKDKEK